MSLQEMRKKLVSNWVFKKARKHLPKMSKTEQEALDSGDSWWEAEVFRGQPDWDGLKGLSLSKLNEEEQAFLDNEVTQLCRMLDEWKIVHEDHDLPEEVWQFIRDNGFFGMVINKQYGGKGFSAAAHSAVVMKIATRSLAAAVTVMVPNSLGPGELLQHYGTDEQKQRFLPNLASGKDIPCFALTGPEAGSDAAAMPDNGVVCKGIHDGREVIGIRLSFNKRYITLAPVATLIGLAFKLYDPDKLLGEAVDLGITVCLLPRNHPGIEIGERHLPLDQVFMNGPIRGKDVFVPIDWIIGGAKMAGQGWRMLVECLAIGRAISLPAVSTGYAALCFCMTGSYAMVREQFKVQIGKFEGVEEALAQIGGFTYLMEATRLMTLTAVDRKIKPATASAIAKYHLTEMGRKVLNHAMDIHGGRGIILGPRNYLGRAYQGMPICITVEGANILTRNLIIFGQGAMSCHPFIRKEYEAMLISDEVKAASLFDQALFGHLGYFFKNLGRHTLYRLVGGLGVKIPKGPLQKYQRQISILSTRFSVLADLSLMILQGELKRKERLSARLGDAMSHLYMASAVVKYFDLHDQPKDELIFAEWAIQYCLHKAGDAISETIVNFTNPIARGLLRLLVQFGANEYALPSDKLDHRISQAMQKDSALRQRLVSQCYIPQNSQDSVGRMEASFQAILAAEPAMIKFKAYLHLNKMHSQLSRQEQVELAFKNGALTQGECYLILEAEKLRQDAIQVDSFRYRGQ